MNLVDSCGWLEYFAAGPNAEFFAPAIEDLPQLIVPTLCLFEVFKRVLQQRGQGDALRAIGAMRQARCIDLTDSLALGAAQLSVDLKLTLADSIIFHTAQVYGALLWTQDAHFERLGGVRFVRKSATP
jgi:toxin FitB